MFTYDVSYTTSIPPMLPIGLTLLISTKCTIAVTYRAEKAGVRCRGPGDTSGTDSRRWCAPVWADGRYNTLPLARHDHAWVETQQRKKIIRYYKHRTRFTLPASVSVTNWPIANLALNYIRTGPRNLIGPWNQVSRLALCEAHGY